MSIYENDPRVQWDPWHRDSCLVGSIAGRFDGWEVSAGRVVTQKGGFVGEYATNDEAIASLIGPPR